MRRPCRVLCNSGWPKCDVVIPWLARLVYKSAWCKHCALFVFSLVSSDVLNQSCQGSPPIMGIGLSA